MKPSQFFTSLLLAATSARAADLLLTNDDGWAVAMIRAQFRALEAARHSVVLSSPAVNKSGTGSSTATPTPLTTPCEFDTCPVGSPAEGFNASNPRLNYVNAFPVDAARFGIQTLAPKFFHGRRPEFVVSGPNVGYNLGPITLISGTVGAATEAALEGVPSVAFSANGSLLSQVSYTTLESDPTSTDTQFALIYSRLVASFVHDILASPKRPILPKGISLNVNIASTGCPLNPSLKHFKWVFTRINNGINNSTGHDIRTCGSTTLPDETDVINAPGCFSSVSVFNASNKGDVDAATQAVVHSRLEHIFTCFHS